MRVAVDLTSLLDSPTGVTAVARRLTAGLAADPSLELVGYAASWRGRGRLADLENEVGIPIGRRPMAAQPLRRAWLRWDAPTIEWWTGPVDVVWGPNFVVPPARHAAALATVHDLTCIRFPEMVTPDVAQYPALLRRAAARGAHIHAVSEFIRAEVVELLGFDEDRVHVVANGVDPADVTGGDRYVLSMATLEPRKDLVGLVQAFDRAAADDDDLRLVLAGADGWGADAVREAVSDASHRDRIVRLGYVDDRLRRDLLAGGLVLAYPSRYEGFGLPPLEAMAAGLAVVATAVGAIAEVCGDAAELVPPGDPEALAAALVAVTTDDAARAVLVARGRARAAMYSWSRSVSDFRQVLDAVVHSAG